MMAIRGQLQTLEPILITIFLALIIGILLLVYVRISGSRGTDLQSVQESQDDVATLARIATLPELKCSNAFENCIDKQKAIAFSQIAAGPGKVFYHPMFGDVNITISWIDLQTGATGGKTLYDSLNSTNVKTTVTYFTIYNPVTNARQFATLMITRRA